MLQGIVSYSELSGNYITIENMQSRVWNYDSSAVSMCAPSFAVKSGTLFHSTNAGTHYNGYSVPPGTNNYYTHITWQNFLNTYYNGASNRYQIPQNSSQTDVMLSTLIGIYADDYYEGGIAYNYTAYWHGDGYVKIYDNVANTPYWTSINLTPLSKSGSDKITNAVSEHSNCDTTGSQEPITYTVGSATSDSNNKIFFSISADAQNPLQFTSLPVLSLDENFLNLLPVDKKSISLENGNTMCITTQCVEEYQSIFIKMPDITLLDNSIEITTDCNSGVTINELTDDTTGIKLLELTFDKNAFPITPQSATLLASQNIECFSSTVFFDEYNNVISGTMLFALPNDFVLNDDFQILLQGALVNVAGPTYKLNMQ